MADQDPRQSDTAKGREGTRNTSLLRTKGNTIHFNPSLHFQLRPSLYTFLKLLRNCFEDESNTLPASVMCMHSDTEQEGVTEANNA